MANEPYDMLSEAQVQRIRERLVANTIFYYGEFPHPALIEQGVAYCNQLIREYLLLQGVFNDGVNLGFAVDGRLTFYYSDEVKQQLDHWRKNAALQGAGNVSRN